MCQKDRRRRRNPRSRYVFHWGCAHALAGDGPRTRQGGSPISSDTGAARCAARNWRRTRSARGMSQGVSRSALPGESRSDPELLSGRQKRKDQKAQGTYSIVRTSSRDLAHAGAANSTNATALYRELFAAPGGKLVVTTSWNLTVLYERRPIAHAVRTR